MTQPERILVVNDERSKSELLRYLLEGQGYEVEQAHSSAETLTRIHQTQFHLVLVDMRIPGTDGPDLVRRIREANSDTPVIVMTGYSSLEHAVEAVRYSGGDYLANPSDNPDEVLAAVRRELADQRTSPSEWAAGPILSAVAA